MNIFVWTLKYSLIYWWDKFCRVFLSASSSIDLFLSLFFSSPTSVSKSVKSFSWFACKILRAVNAEGASRGAVFRGCSVAPLVSFIDLIWVKMGYWEVLKRTLFIFENLKDTVSKHSRNKIYQKIKKFLKYFFEKK